MIIAVDIGNSSINIGYFADRGLVVQKIETHPKKSAEGYAAFIGTFMSQNHIEKKRFSVIISSVVSGYAAVLEETFRRLSAKEAIDILTVSNKMNSGLRFEIRNPEELGTDRIANAAAAWERYKSPVAVVDVGTATTITVIGKHANFIGGAIMPGLGLMNEVLERRTSRLKGIVLESPASALGKDTAGSIRSGLFYGTAGAIERILSEIGRETDAQFTIVITGGYGQVVDKFIEQPHEINPNLTLEGLKILYEKNRPS